MSAVLNLSDEEDPDKAVAARPAYLLHLVTCGSVDDGKSTLLGRLLFDSDAVLDDQLTALDRDSKRFGTQGEVRDFALLVDGLSAEREQGITIDVAYRYFSTPNRSFILADAPGHEQYTRNMATGASKADLAIILVDARKGVLPQTRRHSYIVSMLGVRHVVLVVNKMDLVDFSSDVWRRIVADYGEAASDLGFGSIVAIPICAREGDNIVIHSDRTPWYEGPALLEHLETVSVEPTEDATKGFRFPVQYVNRPNADFRGYAGTVANGVIYARQPVIALPGGQRSRIDRIVTADGDLTTAIAGKAVTLTLTDEIDVSRGDVIVPADDPLSGGTEVTARVLWMAEAPLSADQTLQVKVGTATANARIARVHCAIDIHSFEPHPAATLAMNEIGVVEVVFDRPLVTADYATDRELGALVLVDRMTNQTVALGVVERAPARAASDEPAIRTRPNKVHRVIGYAGSMKRAVFLQRMTGRFLRGLVLFGIVVWLSGNWTLASVVGSADVILGPILNGAVASAWRHRRHARSHTELLGAGH
jgi:bifunctional enzyme CysN/CysC